VVRVRAAALALRNGSILLARHVKDGRTSFLLPGGGVDAGEFAHSALARELREEAQVTATIGSLRYVIEARTPDGSRHIVQLVFDATFDGDVGPSTDPRVAACEWHLVHALRTLPFYPAVGSHIADDLENRRAEARYILAPWIDV